MILPLAALILAVNSPTHLVYTYKDAAAMQSAQSFAPALSSFDKTAGAGNAAMSSKEFDNNAASGTIALDVVQPLSPDGSTVFRVTETGFNSGKPFMCAAYGDTGNVVCDADRPLRPDALLLLRVAGAGFYSPARLDANKHWHIDSPGNNLSESADFTVTKTDGNILTIALKRQGKQQQPPLESTIDGTLLYDTSTQTPKAIHATMSLQPLSGAGAAPVNSRIDVELQP